MNIPISLLGLTIMLIILIQIMVLSVISFPLIFPISRTKNFIVTDKLGVVLYYLIMFQLFTLMSAVLYLLYLEFFVLEFICIVCTVSQLIIILNTVLVGTWSPFPVTEDQKDEIIP